MIHKSFITSINNYKLCLLSFLVFILSLGIRFWNLGDMGQVWDENSLLRDYAWHHIKDAINLDFGNDFWWKGTPDHPPLVRYIRGVASIPDIIGWDKNNLPIYDYNLFYNRLLSIVLGSLTTLMVFLIGTRYISLFGGTTSAIIFTMLPIPLGHSQLAMLEPLALFSFTASIYMFFLFLEKPNNKRLTIAGVALGIALLSRETHIMILPIMLITIFIKNKTKEIKELKHIIYKTLGIYGVAFLTFFIFWPMPFFHLSYMIHYFFNLRVNVSTSIPEVFFGVLMFVPIPYYFFYFIITTPLLIYILGILGLFRINKSNNWVWYTFIIWFCFPFILSLYPNRQQGIRYIIQICVPFALIASLGLESFVVRFKSKVSGKIFLILLLFLYQFLILWRITPYYIDYFNILVGGAKGVYEKKLFHLAWWGEGLKEAFEFLQKEAPVGSRIGVATSPDHILLPLPGREVTKYSDTEQFDFVVVNFYHVVRIEFDDTFIKNNYDLAYVVKADGAHLVEVYQKKEQSYASYFNNPLIVPNITAKSAVN